MKNKFDLHILNGCDTGVSEAIDQFRKRWHPYSTRSWRYPINGLIREIIDPALSRYAAELESRYLNTGMACIGSPTSLSELIRVTGFNETSRAMRICLDRYVRFTESFPQLLNQNLIHTYKTLINLVQACKTKRPLKLKVGDGLSMNTEGAHAFCRWCGNRTEINAFLENGTWASPNDNNYELKLSRKYCIRHRRLNDDAQNTSYLRAKRNQDNFDLELERLYSELNSRHTTEVRTTNLYIRYFAIRALDVFDLDERESYLRNQARKMVDCKLSDRRKQIAMMLASGFSQSKIATTLNISRSMVSKDLAQIPPDLRIDIQRPHTIEPPSSLSDVSR